MQFVYLEVELCSDSSTVYLPPVVIFSLLHQLDFHSDYDTTSLEWGQLHCTQHMVEAQDLQNHKDTTHCENSTGTDSYLKKEKLIL